MSSSLELHAELERGVYLVNETIRGTVSYTNRDSSNQRQIAWSCVQINCHCLTSSTSNALPSDSTSVTSFNNAHHANNTLLFSTKPNILFCDMILEPSETRTFTFSDTIPSQAPPSFRGIYLRYTYSVCIGTQLINCPVEFIRLPLRILTTPSDTALASALATLSINSSVDSGTANSSSGTSSLFNGSEASTTKEDTDCESSQLERERRNMLGRVRDMTINLIDNLTSQRTMNTFSIGSQKGRVARFTLLKCNFKLGEDIIGLFDFTDSTQPCAQYSITLQSEEIFLKRGSAITNYCNYSEFCLDISQTQMILSIPWNVTPSFETDSASLNWRLHFEFVTAKCDEVKNSTRILLDKHGHVRMSPHELNVTTMIWNLPIRLFPSCRQVPIGRHLMTSNIPAPK